MATMLTAKELAEVYIDEHPRTSFKKNTIVAMLRSGIIPMVPAGNRHFYSLEAFEAYLEQGGAPPFVGADNAQGVIRRIP